MSSSEASKIYELIVETVINEVREDFENTGVDEQTLQDLKRNWKIKLSETNVAKFSWDTDGTVADPLQPPELVVKQEEEPGLMLPNLENNDVNNNESSNNSSSNSNSNNNNTNDNNNNSNANSDDPNAASRQDPANTGSAENGVASQEVHVKPDPENLTDTLNIQGLNGGELPQGARITVGLELNGNDTDIKPAVGTDVRSREKQAKRSALLDTDEVGSELDDSDDDYLISEGEDDGPDENMMLCLYEKVTRTKARWKCSLKDGVVTINRKDYTFQKAQVEAEWV